MELTAADLPEHIDQIVDPDNAFTAGQTVPNLRSLYRQLPSPGQTPKALSGPADKRVNYDTWIIPMAQLGSADVRQVNAL